MALLFHTIPFDFDGAQAAIVNIKTDLTATRFDSNLRSRFNDIIRRFSSRQLATAKLLDLALESVCEEGESAAIEDRVLIACCPFFDAVNEFPLGLMAVVARSARSAGYSNSDCNRILFGESDLGPLVGVKSDQPITLYSVRWLHPSQIPKAVSFLNTIKQNFSEPQYAERLTQWITVYEKAMRDYFAIIVRSDRWGDEFSHTE